MTSPHFVRSSLDTVPAGQEVQEAASGCFAIEFTGHLVQMVTVLSLNVPAPHWTEIIRIISFYKREFLVSKLICCKQSTNSLASIEIYSIG